MFSGEPDLVKVMSPATMPPSFRVVPARAQSVQQLASDYNKQPGVYNVGYPGQVIKDTLAHFSTLRTVALIVAGGVMLGAIALVVNTIQLAIFARRREVAVMKLVGATNWFIRVPFMLEGLVEGLVGAAWPSCSPTSPGTPLPPSPAATRSTPTSRSTSARTRPC